MLGDEFKLGRVQVDLFRNQQRLNLQVSIRHRRLQPLVEHPFVQRVLINHLDPVATLDHDVAIVHLDGPFSAAMGRCDGGHLFAADGETRWNRFDLLP